MQRAFFAAALPLALLAQPPAAVKTRPARPLTLRDKALDIIACSSPALGKAHIGLHVVQLSTGRTLLDYQGHQLFIPASNTKLFSTALALVRLGPHHRFETRVTTSAPVANGTLDGDLYLIGGGDPTLSDRAYPSQPQPRAPLQALEQLADQVAATGLKIIRGSIIGDDTRYPFDPYPVGWTLDDAVYDYGAPVSALTINDNGFLLELHGGTAASEPVRAHRTPPGEYESLDLRVTTGPDTRVDFHRDGPTLVLSGTVAPGARWRERLALHNPALYAARALADMLIRRGIRVEGPARSRSWREGEPFAAPPEVAVLARRQSPPLVETLRVINKVSHNLHAELALRETARVTRGIGSRRAALDELWTFLSSIGVPTECCFFQDGSGLSRQTLVTPAATTMLLRHLYGTPHRDDWISLLPIGGVDGSLARRFGKHPRAAQIRAKTGGLAHVATMSGYINSRTHGELAVSLMINNYNSEGSEARELLDRLAILLLD